MKFAFLDDYRGNLSKARACRVMGVTDRGLRAWKQRPPSQRQRRDMVLLAHIRDQHRSSLGSYGRPRMTEELNELGVRVGHPLPGNGLLANRERGRVGRLMRQNAISVVRTHKFKATTDSDHGFNIAPNLLQQDFAASQANQKWAGDITYVWTREGWVYLAVILDLHSRRVIALRDLHANPFRVTVGPSATA
jgi:putative transposase